MDKEYEIIKEALHHLMWVWASFDKNSSVSYDEGMSATQVNLCHQFMQAGEQAGDLLEKYGLAEDGGYGWDLTEKGLALFNQDLTK